MLQTSGIRRAIGRVVSRKAHRVIAISKFTEREVVKLGVEPDRIVVITPGVDVEPFMTEQNVGELRAGMGLEDCKVILTVGRLTKRKGHAQVIKALPSVLKAVPNARYLIVGTDMGEEENLRALAKTLDLEDHVLFVGHVSMEDLPKYYHLCDLFVMANYELEHSRDTEGFGIVFLEANACGKPVLGGRAGGVEDAVIDGETGLLVDATDTNELSQTLLRLLMDREYSTLLGTNGRRRVVKSSSWDAKAEQARQVGLAAATSTACGYSPDHE
jgi:phosphatidylinositol alpha-1,6-mannosyltransferase